MDSNQQDPPLTPEVREAIASLPPRQTLVRLAEKRMSFGLSREQTASHMASSFRVPVESLQGVIDECWGTSRRLFSDDEVQQATASWVYWSEHVSIASVRAERMLQVYDRVCTEIRSLDMEIIESEGDIDIADAVAKRDLLSVIRNDYQKEADYWLKQGHGARRELDSIADVKGTRKDKPVIFQSVVSNNQTNIVGDVNVEPVSKVDNAMAALESVIAQLSESGVEQNAGVDHTEGNGGGLPGNGRPS